LWKIALSNELRNITFSDELWRIVFTERLRLVVKMLANQYLLSFPEKANAELNLWIASGKGSHLILMRRSKGQDLIDFLKTLAHTVSKP